MHMYMYVHVANSFFLYRNQLAHHWLVRAIFSRRLIGIKHRYRLRVELNMALDYYDCLEIFLGAWLLAPKQTREQQGRARELFSFQLNSLFAFFFLLGIF